MSPFIKFLFVEFSASLRHHTLGPVRSMVQSVRRDRTVDRAMDAAIRCEHAEVVPIEARLTQTDGIVCPSAVVHNVTSQSNRCIDRRPTQFRSLFVRSTCFLPILYSFAFSLLFDPRVPAHTHTRTHVTHIKC